MFAMRASGTPFRKIATTLNDEGIQPPGELYYQRQGRSAPAVSTTCGTKAP